MNYQTMTIFDIIEWCTINKKEDWLKETDNKLVPCKVYPTKIVIDENGKRKRIADKEAKPTIEMRKITFIQLKRKFVEEFMPEIAPSKKPKKKTFHDLIAEL